MALGEAGRAIGFNLRGGEKRLRNCPKCALAVQVPDLQIDPTVKTSSERANTLEIAGAQVGRIVGIIE